MMKRRKQKRAGAAAVEFAFVAPVVFLFVFAAFEFMRVSMLQSAADVASYEACREVIVPGAKINEAIAEADKYLNYLGSRSKTVTVTALDSNDVVQSEIDDFTSTVKVEVNIPIRSNVLLLSRFFGDREIYSATELTFESYNGFYNGGQIDDDDDGP